jgi:hypothetical protein
LIRLENPSKIERGKAGREGSAGRERSLSRDGRAIDGSFVPREGAPVIGASAAATSATVAMLFRGCSGKTIGGLSL